LPAASGLCSGGRDRRTGSIWTRGPSPMITVMDIVVLSRNFVSGFPRPHNGGSINAGASKEDIEEEGGGKNGCHGVIVAVCVENRGIAETMYEPKKRG
jgi:hypothetical protein